jgi:hypothetical protein
MERIIELLQMKRGIHLLILHISVINNIMHEDFMEECNGSCCGNVEHHEGEMMMGRINGVQSLLLLEKNY